jgi:hypothetical protein
MTKVVIVGEIYYGDRYPDQGLPPGQGGHPSHPIAPGGQPPGYWGGVAPPTVGNPIAPGGQPPGYWGGSAPPYPDQGLPGQPPGYWGGVAPPHPDQGLPPGGEEIPPDELPLPEPPAEYSDDLVIAIRKPGQPWEVRAYDIQPDQGQPQPTPQSSPPRAPTQGGKRR